MQFNQLPADVQNKLSQNHITAGDGLNYTMKPNPSLFQTNAGVPVYVGCSLNYDLRESNFALYLINLTEIYSLDFNPCNVDVYQKADPALDAYIIVVDEGREAPNYVFQCT